jgi:hypothetical protein
LFSMAVWGSQVSQLSAKTNRAFGAGFKVGVNASEISVCCQRLTDFLALNY